MFLIVPLKIKQVKIIHSEIQKYELKNSQLRKSSRKPGPQNAQKEKIRLTRVGAFFHIIRDQQDPTPLHHYKIK